MEPHSLIADLKQRRVFRALVGYAVAAFAVLQIIEPIMHGLHWPDSVLTYVVVTLALGFPLVVAVAWIFDLNDAQLSRSPHVGRPHLSVVLATSAGLAAAVLAKVPGLRVAARTSTFAFKGKSEDVRTIAQKLDVTNILEGSVRKAGDQIRVSTQLINAQDGYRVWSETYDRKLTDVLALQQEIAKAVADALRLRLLPQAAQPRRTGNAEAYNQFLLGNRFFHTNNLPGFERAVQAYRKAVALDPHFAAAWAGLANAEFWFGKAGTGRGPRRTSGARWRWRRKMPRASRPRRA